MLSPNLSTWSDHCDTRISEMEVVVNEHLLQIVVFNVSLDGQHDDVVELRQTLNLSLVHRDAKIKALGPKWMPSSCHWAGSQVWW